MQERAASASADARAESSRRGRDADRGDRNHANRGGASRADGEESRGAGGGGPGGGASAPTPGLRLIRTGEMEFEVESFDGALMTVARIALEEQGVVASTNSEKLPNGKVRGVVTLRVPPEHLDNLVLKLRALGDLKSQRIVSQDVTKAWSDFSSELRAARAMEERLLEILRTARGKIEELLAVEKELSTWRGRIEQIQGELNFLNDRISMSTLTLTLSEKDIRQPHTAVRREVGTAGLETDAVEEAYKAVLKSVEEAEGRVIDSHLQQHDAGQVTARIQYEVAPDRFGGLIDRLRQLGNVVRLQVQREETLEGDATTHGPVRPSEVRQDPSRMTLSLYNLTNIAPRRSTQAVLAAPDAEGAYQAVLKVATDHGGRVVRSNLNRGRPETVTGSATLEVPSTSAGAALEAFRTLGELLQLAVVENPDTQGTTDAKEGFQLTIRSLAGVDPRETVSLQFASTRVEEAYGQILAFAEEADARIRVSNLQKTDERNVIGQLDFDLPSGRREAFEGRLASLGEVTQRQSRRADDAAQVVDSKFRVSMVLFDVSQVQPRETAVVGLEVSDVEEIRARLLTLVTDAGGRVVDSNLRRDADGRVVGSATCDVPMSAYGGVMNQVNSLGDVQSLQVQKNHNVPDSQIASARLQVTLSNRALIIPADGGIFARLRKDLGTSFAAVMKLLGLVLIGLSVAAPCLAILYAGVFVWRIVRKGRAA
ncbi:MAG: DUF4349 domain-containing protein, partial [Planctomycetes bacterium]|nr:DUF4349 domain-containing protein [Planctomycetota bacterium]